MINKFSSLPLSVKIVLLLFLGLTVWMVSKNPERIIANVKLATRSIERKAEGLVAESEDSQGIILGEKIYSEEKIKDLSDELLQEVVSRFPKDLPAQVKQEIEEKVRMTIEERIEDLISGLVIERVKQLPESAREDLKEEICE